MLVDAVLAIVCAVTAAGPAMDSTVFAGSPYLAWHPPLFLAVPLAVLVGAAAFVRRRRPVLFAALATAGWIVAATYPAVMLAQYTIGARIRSARLKAVLISVLTVAVAVPFRRAGLDAIIPLSVAVCVAPALLGMVVTGRHERIEKERDRVRAEERARIAHDMHDVVTHRVSLMVLHATALEVAEPHEQAVIAQRIRGIGRDALDELRSLVGVLHEGDAPLAPQPGIADLARLAEQTRAAGTAVTVETIGLDGSCGAGGPVPLIVEQAVFRLVQEALTNAVRHAGPCSVRVRLEAAERLKLSIVDDGRGGAGAAGNGIRGMRERVAALGGTFQAGPTGHGFAVRAELPL
jgi:signal transduction histidine kinase